LKPLKDKEMSVDRKWLLEQLGVRELYQRGSWIGEFAVKYFGMVEENDEDL
jgi:hypothetical protein